MKDRNKNSGSKGLLSSFQQQQSKAANGPKTAAPKVARAAKSAVPKVPSPSGAKKPFQASKAPPPAPLKVLAPRTPLKQPAAQGINSWAFERGTPSIVNCPQALTVQAIGCNVS